MVIVEQAAQYAAANPMPAWLEVNYENLSGRVLSLPKRKDIALPINEQLIVELVFEVTAVSISHQLQLFVLNSIAHRDQAGAKARS